MNKLAVPEYHFQENIIMLIKIFCDPYKQCFSLLNRLLYVDHVIRKEIRLEKIHKNHILI